MKVLNHFFSTSHKKTLQQWAKGRKKTDQPSKSKGKQAQTDQQVLMEQIAKLINGDGLNARGYPRVENDKMLLKRQ